jgi:hypothetical protein
VIFLDTSFLYPLFNVEDDDHARVRDVFERLRGRRLDELARFTYDGQARRAQKIVGGAPDDPAPRALTYSAGRLNTRPVIEPPDTYCEMGIVRMARQWSRARMKSGRACSASR